MNRPIRASGTPEMPEYLAKKKPPRKNGKNCGRPITLMVIANPRAGRILPVMLSALVIQAGKLFIKVPTASAPKCRAKNIGIAKIKNLMICGSQKAMNRIPLVLQVSAYLSARCTGYTITIRRMVCNCAHKRLTGTAMVTAWDTSNPPIIVTVHPKIAAAVSSQTTVPPAPTKARNMG